MDFRGFNLKFCDSFNLDEKYKEVFTQMKADIEKAKLETEKEQIFENFANTYTVVPHVWALLINK